MRLRSRSGSRRRLLLRQLPGSPELPRFRRAHVRRRRERGSRRAERGEASRKEFFLASVPPSRARYFFSMPGALDPINLLSASLALRLRRARAARHSLPTLSPPSACCATKTGSEIFQLPPSMPIAPTITGTGGGFRNRLDLEEGNKTDDDKIMAEWGKSKLGG